MNTVLLHRLSALFVDASALSQHLRCRHPPSSRCKIMMVQLRLPQRRQNHNRSTAGSNTTKAMMPKSAAIVSEQQAGGSEAMRVAMSTRRGPGPSSSSSSSSSSAAAAAAVAETANALEADAKQALDLTSSKLSNRVTPVRSNKAHRIVIPTFDESMAAYSSSIDPTLLCNFDDFGGKFESLRNKTGPSNGSELPCLRSNVYNFINKGIISRAGLLLERYDRSCRHVFKHDFEYKGFISKLLDVNNYILAGKILDNLVTKNKFVVKNNKVDALARPDPKLFSLEMKVIKKLHLHGGVEGAYLALKIFDTLLFTNKQLFMTHFYLDDDMFVGSRPQQLNQLSIEENTKEIVRLASIKIESSFKLLKEMLFDGLSDNTAVLKYLVYNSHFFHHEMATLKYLRDFADLSREKCLLATNASSSSPPSSLPSSEGKKEEVFSDKESQTKSFVNSSLDSIDRIICNSVFSKSSNWDVLRDVNSFMKIMSVYIDDSSSYFNSVLNRSGRMNLIEGRIVARKLSINESILGILTENRSWLCDPKLASFTTGSFMTLLWAVSYECRTNGHSIADIGYFSEYAVCHDNQLDTLGINLAKSFENESKSDIEFKNLSKYSKYFHEKYKLDVKLSKDDIFTKLNNNSNSSNSDICSSSNKGDTSSNRNSNVSKAQFSNVDSKQRREKPDFKVDISLDQAYRNLVSFFCDETVQEIYVRPQNSYERRLYRTLCDEFDFNHYFIFESKYSGRTDNVDNSSDFYSNQYLPTIYFDEYVINRGMLKITKKPKNSDISIPLIDSRIHGMIRPRRLYEMLLDDSSKGRRRSFDGEMPLWAGFVSKMVSPSAHSGGTVSEQHDKLKDLASIPLLKCGDRYSIQWALCWTDVLVKNNIPFPRGMLSNLLKHAVKRSDIHGIMEVLVYAVQEGYRFKRMAAKMQQLGLGAVKIDKLKDALNYSWDALKVPNSSSGAAGGGSGDGSNTKSVRSKEDKSKLGVAAGIGGLGGGFDNDLAYLRSFDSYLVKNAGRSPLEYGADEIGSNFHVNAPTFSSSSASSSASSSSSYSTLSNRVDGLSEAEWGEATTAIVRIMEEKLTFQENILLEVIRLLKEYGEKLEINGLRAMLHYLTIVRPSSSMTPQILGELFTYSKASSRYINDQTLDDFTRIILTKSMLMLTDATQPFSLGALKRPLAVDINDIIQEYKPRRNQQFPTIFDQLLSTLNTIDATNANKAHSNILNVLLFYHMHSTSSIEGKIRLFLLLSRFSDRFCYNSADIVASFTQSSSGSGVSSGTGGKTFDNTKPNDVIRDVICKMFVYSAFQLVESAPFTYLPTTMTTATTTTRLGSKWDILEEDSLGERSLVYDDKIYNYLVAMESKLALGANSSSSSEKKLKTDTAPASKLFFDKAQTKPLNFHTLVFQFLFKQYQNLDHMK